MEGRIGSCAEPAYGDVRRVAAVVAYMRGRPFQRQSLVPKPDVAGYLWVDGAKGRAGQKAKGVESIGWRDYDCAQLRLRYQGRRILEIGRAPLEKSTV